MDPRRHRDGRSGGRRACCPRHQRAGRRLARTPSGRGAGRGRRGTGPARRHGQPVPRRLGDLPHPPGRRRSHQVSPGLAETVGVALAAARWTGGLVDPTVGAAVIRSATTATSRPSAPDRAPPSRRRPSGPGAPCGPGTATVAPAPVPGWASVRLEGTRLTVPVRGLSRSRGDREGTRLRSRRRRRAARGLRGRRPGQPGRRHRRRRRAAGRRLADDGGRFLQRIGQHGGRDGWSVPARPAGCGSRGHVLGDHPAVAAARAAGAPHRGPAHRPTRRAGRGGR